MRVRARMCRLHFQRIQRAGAKRGYVLPKKHLCDNNSVWHMHGGYKCACFAYPQPATCAIPVPTAIAIAIASTSTSASAHTGHVS